ncbi:hypothetical protein PBOI14_22000 [Pseudomonas sp. Boi14]|nr:hypothetical protein PBOI14_22000 [Pseudomonas sp. Boi14]
MGALQHASNLLSAVHPLHKKLHEALKSGQVKPAAGESAIDAALEAGVLQAAEARACTRPRRRGARSSMWMILPRRS